MGYHMRDTGPAVAATPEGMRWLQSLRCDVDVQLPLLAVTALVLALCVWPLRGLSWEEEAGATASSGNPTDAGAAAHQAAKLTGGRVLDVQTRFDDERPTYLVKVLLDDGHVKIVEIAGPAPPPSAADVDSTPAAVAEQPPAVPASTDAADAAAIAPDAPSH